MNVGEIKTEELVSCMVRYLTDMQNGTGYPDSAVALLAEGMRRDGFFVALVDQADDQGVRLSARILAGALDYVCSTYVSSTVNNSEKQRDGVS